MLKKYILRSLPAVLLVSLFFVGAQIVWAEGPAENPEKNLAVPTDTVQDDGVLAGEEGNETYTAGDIDALSPEKKVRIKLNDNLSAFISFGAPTIGSLDGNEDDVNYRATLGINIPL